MAKKKNTRPSQSSSTSAFGSPGRSNHDASRFYNSRLYRNRHGIKTTKYHENPLPETAENRVFLHSSESMGELPDCCVHLMVTSPPYNVTKEYDHDLSLEDYRALLRRVWAEVYRVLVPGGRACINIANVGRKPYIPLHTYLIEDLLDLGFLMRGEIIWNKAASAGGSTAWGSWRSAANPTLRDVHEYILVFCKDTFRRANPQERTSTISRDEFLEYTRSTWSMGTVSARKIGHPAPFPVELPYRLIQLYTFAGEVILDPFMGSGQTALAALKAGRTYVGYETDPGYAALAETRITAFLADQSDTGEE
jgi:site-specific DNA-methyltransferase (adenine-specific)